MKRWQKIMNVLVFVTAQILSCPIFGQPQEQQLTLEYEPDSCIWNLNIEQVSKEEFTKAYNRSAPYNGRIDSITDAQLNRELIECAVKTFKQSAIIYEDENLESLHDTYWDIYSYSLTPENGDTLYAVRFTDPIRSFSCILYKEEGMWRGDSLVVETENEAFSKDGLIAGAQGFDCDDYALIHFYKMFDTSSGKRMRRIVSYSNLDSKDIDNLDATWAVDTSAPMFWSDTLNTLYVRGYTIISVTPVFFKITLYTRETDIIRTQLKTNFVVQLFSRFTEKEGYIKSLLVEKNKKAIANIDFPSSEDIKNFSVNIKKHKKGCMLECFYGGGNNLYSRRFYFRCAKDNLYLYKVVGTHTKPNSDKIVTEKTYIQPQIDIRNFNILNYIENTP